MRYRGIAEFATKMQKAQARQIRMSAYETDNHLVNVVGI